LDYDPQTQLYALRVKLADVQARQRQAADPRDLWNYACDLQDAIWSLEEEMGLTLYSMGWIADA
jgi:hypothetical protein